jgi:hypothetical protein
MRTKELVKMLRARFGDVVVVSIRFFRMVEHKDKGTAELEGVLEVLAGNKILCGGTVVHAECNFINAIYSMPLGVVVHGAVTHQPAIYARYRKDNVTFFLYVPCTIDNVDINKFEPVAEAGRECPFEGTDICPLYRACRCK